MGVEHVVITNAAGALNPSLDVGTIVIVQDHVALPNLTGLNPLLGPQLLTEPEHERVYPRFLPLSDAYSCSLRKLVFHAAHGLSLPSNTLGEGTYTWSQCGGMSTVPEVMVAKEEGMEVLVLSLVTNKVAVLGGYESVREEVEAEVSGKSMPAVVDETVSHEEVLAIGSLKGDVMKMLVETVVICFDATGGGDGGSDFFFLILLETNMMIV
ncbi:hypothetical protein D9757_012010 [Collybiopsis confluens]|uniref:purine-nucleoside phosphorylase n=1 Tax=Collybiopsis confluens TaxID=2823264 RepID=A0A8H5GS92_9AGAR|nr:hypothetical protein D9757_012010 [Collybiopsis confluens]